MADRYEQIISALDKKHPDQLRICKSNRCSCCGCCGSVGSKRVTQRELEMYKAGDMQKIINNKTI